MWWKKRQPHSSEGHLDAYASYVLPMALSAHVSYRGQRAENQDRVGQFATTNGMLVCVVADGMETYGRSISDFVVDRLAEMYGSYAHHDPMQVLQWCVETINHQVTLWREGVQIARPGGCTLDVAVILPGRLLLAHVGDGRCYLLRGTDLSLLTHDHAVSANRLSRFMGMRQSPVADYRDMLLQSNDYLVMCSDGMWGPLIWHDFVSHTYRRTPAGAALSLLRLAIERGSDDNISGLVVQMR
jgi:PPM family protein phosphatase